jgi:D-glucuronyl C5-epimerase C-terminus
MLKAAGPRADAASVRTLALLALATLAGCGGASAPRPVSRPVATWATGAPLEDGHAPKAGWYAALQRTRADAAARRRAAIAAARRSPTVFAALRVARLTGRITPAAERRLRRDWTAANVTLARLTGTRHSELAYVMGTVATLAAQHALTADRIDPTFLVLRFNTSFWARAPLPAAGLRTSFGRDPAIFQYYPGHGMQLQPLASWGKANALAGACLKALRTRSRAHPCRRAALTASLDGLSSLAARRNGYLAWEYYFAFGTGVPPWVSGMTQATAVQALARGYRALGVERWRHTALRALGAFERPPPAGVSVPAPGGTHYLLYSFAPNYRVLNGDLQAVIGLRDAAALTHSPLALRLFRSGDAAARRSVAAFDTGAWSLYSAHGAESTLNYHVLTAGFLAGLCDRLHVEIYCRTGARFRRYETQPTRIGVAPLRGPVAHRPTELRFTISKISSVQVRVWNARGLSLDQNLELPRGVHALTWDPPGRGRYRLRIEARGPSGPAGIEQQTIRVRLPKPKPKHRHGGRHRKGLATPGPLAA